MASTMYLTSTVLTASARYSLSYTAPASANSSFGWVVDSKAAPNFSPFRPATLQAANTFVTTEPTAFSTYGFRSPAVMMGTFSDANWVLTVKVRSGATYYAQTGTVRFRLWRSTDATGASATQVTPGWQASSTISFTAAAQEQTATVTWTPGATVALTREYLFLELEWSADNSGGNASAEVRLVFNDGVAKLDTPDYTVAAMITQEPIEVLGSVSPNLRVTQLPIEMLGGNDPAVRVTQQVIEVLYLSAGAKVVMAELY